MRSASGPRSEGGGRGHHDVDGARRARPRYRHAADRAGFPSRRRTQWQESSWTGLRRSERRFDLLHRRRRNGGAAKRDAVVRLALHRRSGTGGERIGWKEAAPRAAEPAAHRARPHQRAGSLFRWYRLCAEAQVVFRRADRGRIDVPTWHESSAINSATNVLLDLGDDEYTVGRPHPMIDPTLRNQMLAATLRDGRTAVLLDVVIGQGAYPDPAGELISALPAAQDRRRCWITRSAGRKTIRSAIRARRVAGRRVSSWRLPTPTRRNWRSRCRCHRRAHTVTAPARQSQPDV